MSEIDDAAFGRAYQRMMFRRNQETLRREIEGNHPHEPWPDVSYGAMARAAAMVAGDPDWVNVTRWPREGEVVGGE